ncbi:hypothetical protein, partial [Flavihumibacter sp. CACIAM 22H1]|uniref:hypothetical protein n=1 Tax=Flavihumibacter sp. CACIAM 22H1 TaxID=1812911 RepID=UPI0025BA97E3
KDKINPAYYHPRAKTFYANKIRKNSDPPSGARNKWLNNSTTIVTFVQKKNSNNIYPPHHLPYCNTRQ